MGWVATYGRTEDLGVFDQGPVGPPDADGSQAGMGSVSPAVLMRACGLCGSAVKAENMVYLPICNGCFGTVQEIHQGGGVKGWELAEAGKGAVVAALGDGSEGG